MPARRPDLLPSQTIPLRPLRENGGMTPRMKEEVKRGSRGAEQRGSRVLGSREWGRAWEAWENRGDKLGRECSSPPGPLWLYADPPTWPGLYLEVTLFSCEGLTQPPSRCETSHGRPWSRGRLRLRAASTLGVAFWRRRKAWEGLISLVGSLSVGIYLVPEPKCCSVLVPFLPAAAASRGVTSPLGEESFVLIRDMTHPFT